VPLTVRALAEALVKHPKVSANCAALLKALAETDDMDSAPTPVDAPPADDAEPDGAVSAAFKSAIMSVIERAMSGDLDPKEALSKVKKLLQSHGEVHGRSSAPAEDNEADTKESKQQPVDYLSLLEEVETECGPEFKPGKGLLKALASLGDPADRKALLAEHRAAKQAAPEKPQSGRTQTGTKRTAEQTIPLSGAEFAEQYRA
jgi:hypothetical protein